MDVVVRAFLAFLFIFLLTRLIGRRELSTLQPFDLLLLVVVGDLLQQGVTQNDLSFTGLVLAVGMFGLLDPCDVVHRVAVPAACARCSSRSP